MKECSKCKIEKESSEFFKDKYKKDGLTYNCKACNKKYSKQYYQENAYKLKKYSKQHYQENAEQKKQYNKKHRESLKDGFHHVYYLPNHNYVGTTDLIVKRMTNHRSLYNRYTDNYEILASFEDRGKALRFERLMHDSGFEGRHNNNCYK
jgi:hypothetical protein